MDELLQGLVLGIIDSIEMNVKITALKENKDSLTLDEIEEILNYSREKFGKVKQAKQNG